MIEPIYQPAASRYEDGMTYRRAGRSGVLLPAFSLGMWHNFGSGQTFSNVRQMAHYAFDRGIVHFDLANNYGPAYGTAEENFGRLMEQSFRPYRDELFISTKAGYDMWPGPYGNWGSRKYLMASLDQSLRRMKLDYVDIFYSHRYDPETPLEETLQALVDIVRAGKALYVGLSRYPLAAARFAFRYLAQRDVPCLLFQDRYNLFDREPDTSGILTLNAEAGAGFVAFSPLAQGLLTDRYLNGIPEGSRMAAEGSLRRDVLTERMSERIRGLHEIAQQRGQTLAEMALAWLLRDKRVTSVIIGASSVAQIEDNLRALEHASFSDDELSRLDALSRHFHALSRTEKRIPLPRRKRDSASQDEGLLFRFLAYVEDVTVVRFVFFVMGDLVFLHFGQQECLFTVPVLLQESRDACACMGEVVFRPAMLGQREMRQRCISGLFEDPHFPRRAVDVGEIVRDEFRRQACA